MLTTMKNTIKLSIWAALIVLANQLTAASAGSYLEVNMTGAKTFELTLKDLKGNVTLSLKDDKRQILYTSTFLVNDEKLKKGFDMNLFSDGRYEIELIDEQKMISIPIIIENDLLNIDLLEKDVRFLPVINQKDDLVSVNMLALEDEFLSIRVFNSANDVVYKETLRGEGNLGKRFDFSKTKEGTYEFQLTSKGNVITREIIIK